MTSTTDNNSDNNNEKVYFRFEGDPSQGITSVDIALTRKELKVFPNSLLTRLADVTWNHDEEAGGDPSNPLISRPLQAAADAKIFQWSPSLAEMIQQCYKRKSFVRKKKPGNNNNNNNNSRRHGNNEEAEKRPSVDLPADVEMPDAFMALDYYGTPLDPDKYDLKLKTVGDTVRAKLFLKEYAKMHKAVEYILDKLRNYPHRETLFLFIRKDVDFSHVNKNRNNIATSRDFFRVGLYNDCSDHAEWVQDAHLRRMFLSKLEEQDLQAEFLQQDFASRKDVTTIFGGDDDDEECLYSRIFTRNGVEKAAVLKITISRKKQRTSY